MKLLPLLLLLATPALAHEVWIEDTPEGGLVLRFAEYGEAYEKSPGALDSVSAPFAWRPSTPPAAEANPAQAPKGEAARIRAGKVDAIEVRKEAEGYALLQAQAKEAVQVETGFTVMGTAGNPEKPASKPYFYARWQPAGASAAKPGLNLDLVPTGKPGEVRVFFRGEPVSGQKVAFHPPTGAEQELTSDENGAVHFDAKAPGLYMLNIARHREKIAGFYGGKPFEVTSHNCSLAWRQP